MQSFSGNTLVSNGFKKNDEKPSPLIVTSVPLSFWGGVDPQTGVIVDINHPLHGSSVSDTIFCLPSGRGSCTASQVLLELILNNKAPRAIVLRDTDGLICVGALVAQEIFSLKENLQIPDIICLGNENFNTLLEHNFSYGKIWSDGSLVVSTFHEDIQKVAEDCSSRRLEGSNFTEEETAMLETTGSEAERMALKVLIRYAKIVSCNPTYVDIETAHIDGCTYIGPGGLEFAQKLVDAGGKVRVPTTLNSGSCDRKKWRELGTPEEYARAAMALGDAYLELGCKPSFTCAPYLLLENPALERGKDVCWGESNAVVYANSVLGSRTEKYADYLDICAALVGKTVAVGVHLEQNRRPEIVLDAAFVLKEIEQNMILSNIDSIDSLFPVLGHLCGVLSDGLVPLLLGLESWNVTKDQLKGFCAAFGTTGTSPLVHIAGITPEALDPEVIRDFIATSQRPSQTVTMDDLRNTYNMLDSSNKNEEVDLVALGNPHLSQSECLILAEMVRGLEKKRFCSNHGVHVSITVYR